MNESSEDFHKRVIDALEQSDARTREDRAARLIWLSAQPATPSAFAGRFEQLNLLEELRTCFTYGSYIATLLTATAFVEQTLVEELLIRADPGPRRTLAQAIQSARAAGFLSSSLLDRADQLRKVRNPLGHYRDNEDPETIVNRFRKAGRHPTSILEEDAKHAVELVYELFFCTLRGA